MDFDHEYDVVVVGFGGAGGAAAIEAADQGARVLILEKASTGGGSTCESGGTLRIIADRERAVDHYVVLADQNTPADVIETFVDRIVAIPDWLRSLGGSVGPWITTAHGVYPAKAPRSAFPGLEASEGLGERLCVHSDSDPSMQGGEALFRLLERNVKERAIDVWCSASATSLISSPDTSRVIGVEGSRDSGSYRVRASAGVILTCGGFNYDHKLHRDYFGVPVPAFSPPGRNTGDGIRMAQQVGADLWHMTARASTFGFMFPEHGAAFGLEMPTAGFTFVDHRRQALLQ